MSIDKITVDIDFLKKYDRAGPRYTSYPTAPYFHDGVGSDEYIRHIKNDDRHIDRRDLSLYFHIPFCDTLCYFCGCNQMVTRNEQKIEKYLEYMYREIEMLKPHIENSRKVAQMAWGGGTPTHLSPDQIRRLGKVINSHFGFNDNAEVSVEIDPRELTRDHLVALKECGFNRCSMGVQDFNPKVQETVNRIQPEHITRQTVKWARELGFESINLDLMYGLPYQTVDSFGETIDRILALDPDRLAVFNYAHLPQLIKHQRIIKQEWLPTPDEKLNLLKLSIERLTDSGYIYIGMDHFAKPDDELTVAMNEGTLYRNFQGYSTHAGLNMFAFGITGISMLSDLYAQNEKTLDLYYAAIDEGRLPVQRGIELTADDRLRREVITELMCNFRLVKKSIETKYDIRFDTYFKDALEKLELYRKDGLIETGQDKLTITGAGRLIIRNIAMCFDAYLDKKDGDGPRFSQTV
jgi:oxygen-independent coproporphyrinogen-3 oxidase